MYSCMFSVCAVYLCRASISDIFFVFLQAINENVEVRQIPHAALSEIEDDVDVSVKKATWKSYFWDTWDKPPAVCLLQTAHSTKIS